ncbi:MAG: hypothetical protein OXE95_06530 [Chloroflexi bacterium]|nr:hypothetical protein [Chloroflexota bacterium]MCY4247216.1 hypothetical protein [Chloroflexota bacterium]
MRWLRGLPGGFLRSPLQRERDFFRTYRLLCDRIAAAPDNLSLRVLRGEMLLERRDYPRARADFAAALGMGEALDMRAGWLIEEQLMRDRALFGLEAVARHLPPAMAATHVEA